MRRDAVALLGRRGHMRLAARLPLVVQSTGRKPRQQRPTGGMTGWCAMPAPGHEASDEAMVSEIEIPEMTIESGSGTNLGRPIILPAAPSSKRLESGQLSLF